MTQTATASAKAEANHRSSRGSGPGSGRASGSSPGQPPRRSLLRRFLPILVAILALVYAVRGIPLHELQTAMSRAPLGLLLLVSAGMAVLNCSADTLAMFYVFRGFGLQLRYFELYTIRAATYTLAVINYHAGQLGIIGFLHRAAKIPLSRAGAIVLFIMGVWVALLMIFATFGAVLGGDKGRALMPVLALFATGLGVYAILLRWPPRFLRQPTDAAAGPASGLVPRLLRLASKVWAPLMEAGLRGHLRALIVRLPHLFVLLLWHFIALRCFGISVPFHVAMLYLPVVFAVAALPISVQGLGTAQVVAKYYFTDFAVGQSGEAAEAAVFAYSLSMTAISTASNLILGLAFLPAGSRLGLEAAAAEAAAAEEDAAAETTEGAASDAPPAPEPSPSREADPS